MLRLGWIYNILRRRSWRRGCASAKSEISKVSPIIRQPVISAA